MKDLSQALSHALKLHARRSTGGAAVSSLSRPLAVASLVLRQGGDEAQAQAALFQGAVERPDLIEIERELGAEVARLAEAFLDPPEVSADAGWRDRKQAYLGKLRQADERSLLAVACGVLQEASELVQDLRYTGPGVWKRFPVHGMEVFWYFRELLQVLNARLAGDRHRVLVSELAGTVRALKGVVFEGERS